MRRNVWIILNMALVIALTVTIPDSKKKFTNVVEQSPNTSDQSLINNSSHWFNINACFNTYLECLNKNRFYTLPYSVEQTNIVMFCHQKKVINRCMRRSKMNILIIQCGLLAEFVLEKGIQADLFQVQYIVHAHRIYYWLCKLNAENIPGWNNPICFAEKFKYCVDHLNLKLCLLGCRNYSDAYAHKDMIDAIAMKNRQALMPIWQQAQTLTVEECYQLYANCSLSYPYLILPYDVDQSNIIHFCAQQHLIDFCISSNYYIKVDFQACGYLAEQSKQGSYEARMLSFAYRIYRYMCEKHEYLIPGWEDPVCFMEKFSYCVIEFNSTLCFGECETSKSDTKNLFDISAHPGMQSKKILLQVLLLSNMYVIMDSYLTD